jgi:tRNA (guanine-N7-)-methyltransferase
VSPRAGHRPIRSFVRRSARMTSAQGAAIERHWSAYGLGASERLDLDVVFGRRAPRVMEIGFGNGDALVAMARAHPERDYLGVDVYEPGIGRLLAALAADGLTNVRVIRGDAVEVLRDAIPTESLDTVLLFFPDPWPKKRHHKRRLVQPAFVTLVTSRLVAGGVFHLATDWQAYAEQMLTVLEAEDGLVNMAGHGKFYTAPTERPVTKFERRGMRLGHAVWDLRFSRRRARG